MAPGSVRDVRVDVCPLLPGALDPPPLEPDAAADAVEERVDELLRLLPDEPDVGDDGTAVVDGDCTQVEPLDGDDV